MATRGLPRGDFYEPRVVHTDQGFVLIPTSQGSQIFYSNDAIHWNTAESPVAGNDLDVIHDLAVGPLGLVAIGEEAIPSTDGVSGDSSRGLVLMSSDGRRWRRISDPHFEKAAMRSVGVSRQGIVVFGDAYGVGPAIWTSPDGGAWLQATNTTGLEVARGIRHLMSDDGRLTAFVSVPGANPDQTLRIEVWQTGGRAEWQKVAVLPESDSSRVLFAGSAPGHWIAFGTTTTDHQGLGPVWTSTDAVHWKIDYQGRPVGAIAADGFIAVGHSGDEAGVTCGSGLPLTGLTWTSPDGTAWHGLATFDGRAIFTIVRVADRVVGLGYSLNDNDPIGLEWEGTLPASVAEPSPTPMPTAVPAPTDAPGGCGG